MNTWILCCRWLICQAVLGVLCTYCGSLAMVAFHEAHAPHLGFGPVAAHALHLGFWASWLGLSLCRQQLIVARCKPHDLDISGIYVLIMHATANGC